MGLPPLICKNKKKNKRRQFPLQISPLGVTVKPKVPSQAPGA
jgi:hypothetical protein